MVSYIGIFMSDTLPESHRRLLQALLVRALKDLRDERRDVRLDAVKWLFCDDLSEFSVTAVCDLLSLQKEALRDFILTNFETAQRITGRIGSGRAVRLSDIDSYLLRDDIDEDC